MASDNDESGLASSDLGKQAVEGVALDELRFEGVEGLGFGAATLKRRLRLLGQLLEHMEHRPAGVHRDRGVVDCDECERSFR